jgi:hypothetical protein
MEQIQGSTAKPLNNFNYDKLQGQGKLPQGKKQNF